MKNVFLILLVIFSLSAQIIPFDTINWQIGGRDVAYVTYLGKKSIYSSAATLTLKDVEFLNGTIEFDIAVGTERGFMGVFFRYDGNEDYEHFYLRPHNSGFEDANSYVPVYHSITSWQLYFGAEYSSPHRYPVNEWFHVKLVILDQQMLVYIENMDTPSLFVGELRHPAKKGQIGFTISGFSPAYLADFKWSAAVDINAFKKYKPVQHTRSDSIIYHWQVSSRTEEEKINKLDRIDAGFLKSFKWTGLEAEATGITNLAKIQGITGKENTALVKIDIESDRDQIKKLHFGYSDRVKVFVNGLAQYQGDNGYRTRDYRYLGTIGLFDDLFLNLKKGKNEIVFAVSESFGGWGIMAKFADIKGIKF